jgi:hypothetical protein
MLRTLLVLALVGCASAPTHTVGSATVAFRAGRTGPVRLVGFVNRASARIAHADVHVSFGMPLPGGDWLAMLEGNLIRFSPDGKEVRWTTKAVDVWSAVPVGADAVIAVGTIADPAALNGARRAMFRIDTTTGALAWQLESEAVRRGARAELVRAGGITIAATFGGATAVDDAGKLQWDETLAGGTEEPRLVATGSHVVVVRSPTRSSSDFGETPLHQPLEIRVLDAATGVERGATQLVANEDYYGYGQVGMTGDGRLVIDAEEVRVHTTDGVLDGQPTRMHSPRSERKLIVVDVRDPAKPAVEARAMPPTNDVELPRSIPAGGVAFLDGYAASGATLGLRIVDLAANKILRAKLLTPTRVHGVSAFVQITHVTRRGPALSFAGIFAGDIGALRGRIVRMDKCAAQDYIECSEGRGDVTLAPFAGFIGSIE